MGNKTNGVQGTAVFLDVAFVGASKYVEGPDAPSSLTFGVSSAIAAASKSCPWRSRPAFSSPRRTDRKSG